MEISAHPHQAKVLQSQARIIAAISGVQGGKCVAADTEVSGVRIDSFGFEKGTDQLYSLDGRLRATGAHCVLTPSGWDCVSACLEKKLPIFSVCPLASNGELSLSEFVEGDLSSWKTLEDFQADYLAYYRLRGGQPQKLGEVDSKGVPLPIGARAHIYAEQYRLEHSHLCQSSFPLSTLRDLHPLYRSYDVEDQFGELSAEQSLPSIRVYALSDLPSELSAKVLQGVDHSKLASAYVYLILFPQTNVYTIAISLDVTITKDEILPYWDTTIPLIHAYQAGGFINHNTMTGAMWLLKEIVSCYQKHKPGTPWEDFLILAPTYKILEQSTLRKVFELFPANSYVYKKQESCLQLVGGGTIFIRSTEKPDTIEGMTVKAAWLDEAGLMKSRTWVNIHARVAAKQGKILLTTTPYNGGWVFKDVVRPWQAGDTDIEVVQWRSVDNPYFPKEEYERAKQRLAPDEFERRYNGQFKKMEGLVYPDWDATTMTELVPPETEFQTVFAGVDYGFSNPTAIIVVGVTKDNRIYVLDEVYKTRLTINDIVNEARELKDRWGIQYFYADPSAPGVIEMLNLNGCAAAPANNDVDSGIPRVRQLIKNHRIKVVSTCYNLIDELELYHYNPNAYSESVPEYKAKPDKVFDHACDAFRYALATHPLEIFDVFTEVKEDKRTLFWKNVADRLKRRTIKIERYGQDYPDEDTEVIDSLYI